MIASLFRESDAVFKNTAEDRAPLVIYSHGSSKEFGSLSG